MSLITLTNLLFFHFIMDFVFQTTKMASNKSKSNKWLLTHVLIYQIPFSLFVGPVYGLLNGALHFLVDYFTSRITSKLWEHKKVHEFFIVIGFDQLIHMYCLFISYYYLYVN